MLHSPTTLRRRGFVGGLLGGAALAGLPIGAKAVPGAASNPGFVLGTGPAGRFDDAKIGGPNIIWNAEAGEYWMYYYGRSASFPSDVAPTFGTGSIGLATSSDCISWKRYDGHEAEAAIMVPNSDPDAFDSQMVGTGEVIRHGDEWIMAYFGGDSSIPLEIDGKAVWESYQHKGFRCRPGIARSKDGIHWERVAGSGQGGAAIDIGNAIYGAFPAIIHDGERFLLYYSALPVGTAYWETRIIASDDLSNWTEIGVLRWEDGPRVWERRGMVSRQIVPNFLNDMGQWLMVYAGLDPRPQSTFRLIGAAVSDDAINWRHLYDEPIFWPSALDRWDGAGVAYPNLIRRGDDVLMSYYGFADSLKTEGPMRGIGLAVSTDGTLKGLRRYGE